MHGFMSVRLSVCHKSELCFGSLQTVLFSSISTHHSTDLLTARGVAHLVVHGTTGSTSYETIPPVRLESSGARRAVDRGHGGATTRRLSSAR